ncbi:MAG: hypothetical protein H6740_14805, partial [Alphaproteobacteria bacterium]|nr:hypothetical protein [Alphaproteobacteria bacterium]
MILAALVAAAAGADVYEGEVVDLDLGGDVKAFTIATFPYEHVLMAESPTGQGLADLRAKLDLRVSSWLRFTAHHAITSFIPAPASAGGLGGFASAGAGLTAPEAVDLTWELPGEDEPRDSLYVRGRTDRLMLSLRLPHVDLTLGRQPVTFGKGMFFTPLDIVNPFSPAVIDSSYKPGVDAARADVYIGMSTQITAVAAYASDWSPDGMIYGLYGQGTIGVWDLGAFAGYVREDIVLGLATAGSAGPVGLRGEASFTLPAEDLDEDPFVR